ncbi:MAG: polysaccharide deacetylase family protein [Thermofilaceae archaeon]
MGEGAGVWIPAFNGKGGHLGMMSPTEILDRDPKLSSLLEEVVTRSIPKYVSLTFDDGSAYTQYNNIKQIISKYGIPVTLFLVTNPDSIRGTLQENPLTDPNERWKIRELHATGLVEIGSHTHTHRDLRQLTWEEIEEELETSRGILEGLIGEPVVSFAYPYGYYDHRVLWLVRKHYRYARATRLYYSDEVPVRPSSTYRIATPLSGAEAIVPFLPVCWMFHGEPLSTIEERVSELIRAGAEFLTFSEFVEKVKRLPTIGLEVTIPHWSGNITSERAIYYGRFPGTVETMIVTNNPNSQVHVRYGVTGAPEIGAAYFSPTVLTTIMSFSEIYNYGGTDVWEVHLWDTANNRYVIRTRKPLNANMGLAIGHIPAPGAAMAFKSLITIKI